MAFIVKHLSRTADGREIVRAAWVEAEALTVGRAADSNIQLGDLGVMLSHATIARRGEGVTVVTEKGVPVKIDGRSQTRGAIDARRGGVIGIGPHRLAVSLGAGDEEGHIVVTVTRDEAAAGARDERRFSLEGVLPPKRASSWAFVALILLSCLAWPIWTYHQSRGVEQRAAGFHADELWSSGALSTAHANLENDCQACHVDAFVSVRDDSCLACHANVHDHAAPARMASAVAPPHQGERLLLAVSDVFNRPRQSCVQCHGEHEGAGAMPPPAQRFCADCHATLDARLADTRLLNASDFGSGHPEFRPLLMIDPGGAPGSRPLYRRVSLDGEPREDTGLKFPHALHLSTGGGVARMTQRLAERHGFGDSLACADCHVPTADGARFLPVAMERDCAMCHGLAFDRIGGTVRTLRHGEPEMVIADIRALYRSTAPPRPVELSGTARRRPGDANRARTVGRYGQAAATRYGRADQAIRAAFSQGGVCFDCHRVQPPSAPGGVDYDILPVRQIGRYLHRGWFDHGAHATEDCATCHVAERSSEASDVLIPGIATCRQCHSGEAARGDAIPSTCALCHSFHADDGAPYLVRASGRGGDPPGRRAAARNRAGAWE